VSSGKGVTLEPHDKVRERRASDCAGCNVSEAGAGPESTVVEASKHKIQVTPPIFEADLEPDVYGYRPQRSAGDAIERVHQHLCDGFTDVVDADLTKYFDTIPHGELMKSIARRIVDRDVLHLIKRWLTVAVEERDEDGKSRWTGGQTCGTPQGGVISPLLANIYMNRFLKYWRMTRRGEQFRARIVTYADDFVILSHGFGAETMQWTQMVMTKLGLSLNAEKTRIRMPAGKHSIFSVIVSGRIVTERTAHCTRAQAPPGGVFSA
jgi:RNA-directed DNA polymerase